MFLYVNFYYPFLYVVYSVAYPHPCYKTSSAGYDDKIFSLSGLDILLFLLLLYFSYLLVSCIILSNFVVSLSYKTQYRNIFLVCYNIFLFGIFCLGNDMYRDAYTKNTAPLLILSLVVAFYIIVTLIIDILRKPKRPSNN